MLGIAGFMAATLLITPPQSAASSVFLGLDANGDSVVDRHELHKLVRGMILSFDEDGNGELDPSALHRMVFHLWDEDDNLFLDEVEFTRVFDWDTELEPLDFSRLDGDGNALLGELEFVAFQERGMYSEWDRDSDKKIDQSEVTAGLLSIFDADGNAVLDAKELKDTPLVWSVAVSSLSDVVPT